MTNKADGDFSDGEVLSASDLNDSFTAVVPVGTVLPWHKSKTNTPNLPNNFVECNGQTISDAESPYDGSTVPNLNGEGRFIRGSSTSGTTQASQNKSHDHNYTLTAEDTYGGGGTPQESNSGDSDATGSTGSSGGSESRPKNISMVWIIRIK